MRSHCLNLPPSQGQEELTLLEPQLRPTDQSLSFLPPPRNGGSSPGQLSRKASLLPPQMWLGLAGEVK